MMGLMGWYRSPIGWEASSWLFRLTPSSGSSSENMMHWVNLVNTGGNLDFDVEKITCPTYCYIGSDDDVRNAKKTRELVNSFPNLKHFHCESGYRHVDFVWSSKSTKTSYDDMIKNINKSIENDYKNQYNINM